MRIRMAVGLSGTAFCLSPGDEHDFEQAEAIRLIEAGFAVPVGEAPKEKAIKPRRKVEKHG